MTSTVSEGFEAAEVLEALKDFHRWPIQKLADAIKDVEQPNVTAEKVMAYFLERIHRLNPKIHAIIATTLRPGADLLAEAKAIDEKILKGEAVGPLAGIPMSIKDTWKVKDMRVRAGGLVDFIATEDSPVVALVRESGAIIVGKDATPHSAEDFQTSAAVGGDDLITTNNPYDLDHTPGGSSGGAAAAVAAGLVVASVGSDAVTSGANPAAFCGISALAGYSLPGTGHVPPPKGFREAVAESGMSRAAVFARTPEDVATLVCKLTGTEDIALDPEKKLTIGYDPCDDDPDFAPDGETREAIEKVLQLAEQDGHTVVKFEDNEALGALTRREILRATGYRFGALVQETVKSSPVHKKFIKNPSLQAFCSATLGNLLSFGIGMAKKREYGSMVDSDAHGAVPTLVAGFLYGIRAAKRERADIEKLITTVSNSIAKLFNSPHNPNGVDIIISAATSGAALPHGPKLERVRVKTPDGERAVSRFDFVPALSAVDNFASVADGATFSRAVMPLVLGSEGLPRGMRVAALSDKEALTGAIMLSKYTTELPEPTFITNSTAT